LYFFIRYNLVHTRWHEFIGYTVTAESRILSSDPCVYNVVSVDLIDFSKCFVDKDDRDEDRETFLREASDVSNEKTEVKGDDYKK